jgi:hypothetical protein
MCLVSVQHNFAVNGVLCALSPQAVQIFKSPVALGLVRTQHRTLYATNIGMSRCAVLLVSELRPLACTCVHNTCLCQNMSLVPVLKSLSGSNGALASAVFAAHSGAHMSHAKCVQLCLGKCGTRHLCMLRLLQLYHTTLWHSVTCDLQWR